MNNVNARQRAKLAMELDREGRWFQKAARRYQTRQWARDMRRALGITMDFLAEETQVARATLYRADRREETGAITIAELEALAEAMECKLVYAMVPERGTVAELAERRREHPRKPRTVREKEAREYSEWYAKEVEKMRKQDPGEGPMAEWREQILKQRADRLKREREGTETAGTEGQRDEGTLAEERGMVWQGTDGLGAPVRPVGAQRIRDAVTEKIKELGPEGEQAIRRAAEKETGKQRQGDPLASSGQAPA